MLAGLTTQTLAIAFLVTVAIGGGVWVFLYPLMSGERHVERRRASVTQADPVVRASVARVNQKSRREHVEDTLKELEEKRKKTKSVPLNIRISQAGLAWSKRQFFLFSAALGLGAFVAVMFAGGGLVPALGVSFAAGCGLPLWILRYLKKRREKKFLAGFPDAVDVIVRGIKAGLPLVDCLKVIAAEATEPVKSEFRAIVETQTIGMPLGEACIRLYDRIPLPEANFFGIVISIQQKAGGNLSEALGNLSRVLRDRKKMQGKIQAMSMEAKASASIIAILPLAVMMLVYLTSPQYIELLWTHSLGRTMLAGSAVWMLMGVLVMRKMINFDF
jgi:tight adherence protein B